MDLREEHFEKAIELLGDDWLNNQLSEYAVESDNKDPLKTEDPPKVVRQFRIAKDDLNGGSENIFSSKSVRPDSVEFLWIGKVYELVEDLPVISPDGTVLENRSTIDLFQERLHKEDQFESAFFELEVAAEYVERGHEPAFVAESITDAKSPDMELLDFDDRLQIECKRCRLRSSEEVTVSNIQDNIFSKIRDIVDSKCYIAVFELSRTLSGDDVVTLSEELPESLSVGRRSIQEFNLPFGKLYILPFFDQGIIEQPIGHLEGFEILTEFYELYVRPVLNTKLDVDKNWEDLGSWVMYSESQDEGSIARHKDYIWIGILNPSNSSEPTERIKNQYRGVSGKFNESPSILHINVPDFKDGDALQDLKIRKQSAGELKQRSEISMVVINSFEVIEQNGTLGIQSHEAVVPNYNPNHLPPDELNLLQDDFDAAIAYDEVVSKADEEYMEDEEGLKELLENKEGTLTFRFTPKESSQVTEAKTIIEEESRSGEDSISLDLTPNETFRLTRATSHGKWICEVTCEDIPEFTPIHFFIVWTPDETRFSISLENWDELRTDVCRDPI